MECCPGESIYARHNGTPRLMPHAETDDLYRTAVHEAGHAVFARALGIEAGGLTIVPEIEASCAGFCEIAPPWLTYEKWDERGRYREMRTVHIGLALVFMGGVAAEAAVLGSIGEGANDDGRRLREMLEEIAADVTGQSRVAHRLQRQAKRIAERHQAPIERVAAALIAAKTLSKDQADDLYRGAGRGEGSPE